MLRTLDSNKQRLSSCYLHFYISGIKKLSRDSSHKGKEKKKNKHSFKVVKILVGTKKFGNPWYVKEKIGGVPKF
jgi:hypothetical protein